MAARLHPAPAHKTSKKSVTIRALPDHFQDDSDCYYDDEGSPSCRRLDRYHGNALVDSPRRIMFEKTVLQPPTTLSGHLHVFYEEVAQIRDKHLTSSRLKTDGLLDYIMPRVKKLGNQVGMRVLGHKTAGGTEDGTAVILPNQVDVFLLFGLDKITLTNMEPGYKYVPLKKFREKEGGKPDQFRFARSIDGTFLSSQRVAMTVYDLVDRALKLNTQVELLPYTEADDTSQIVVLINKGRLKVNLVPACFLDKEDLYLTTRPYFCDDNPTSTMMWRTSFVHRERRLVELINRADRGVHLKAFRVLKALFRVEHTLHGLSSYHLKTVLLHNFDTVVDETPRWQRDDVDTAFVRLMRSLEACLRARHLPHFFVRDYNLLGGVPGRTLAALQARLSYLLNNRNELVRVLRKRSR